MTEHTELRENRAELLSDLRKARVALAEALDAIEEFDDEGARSALACVEIMVRRISASLAPSTIREVEMANGSPPDLWLIEGGDDA
jgi:hypothetical protein